MTAGGFTIHYSKNEIANEVLWENHCHAHYEMIAVITGSVLISYEGLEVALSAGDAIVLPPLCYHTVTANKKCTYRRLAATFDKSAVPTVLQSFFEGKHPYVFRTEKGQTERIRTLCHTDNAAFYAPLLQSLMIEVLYTCATNTRHDTAGITDAPLQAALLYIDEHLCERLTLDEIALHTATSKSFLCHRFREKMKISPKQYILQKRMALAVKLLSEGVPPTQVALCVGYENYSNFYRLYQKYLQNKAMEE